MVKLPDHEYAFFGEYHEDMLADRPVVEQLSILDDEIGNKALVPRYMGPVDPIEWNKLEAKYNDLFSDFLKERVDSLGTAADPSGQAAKFDRFRTDIAELNDSVQDSPTSTTTTVTRPVERLLTKELRRLGYNPNQLDVDHVQSGGTLYLLELFSTALQQESLEDTAVLSTLFDIVDQLSTSSKRSLFESLSFPVLMVDLWKNQRTGLDRWLDNDRDGILEMATATGKTVAGIAAICHLCGDIPTRPNQLPQTNDARIAIAAHSNAILSQWERELRDLLGLSVSSADRSGQPDTLQLATGEIEFHTIHSLLPRYGGPPDYTYDLVICDEAHHYANEGGFGGALDAINRRAMLGLSATIGDDGGPKRGTLEDRLGPVVYTYDVEEAQRDGVIPEFDWSVHPTELNPDETKEWQETTNRISNLFKRVRGTEQTRRILGTVEVPFGALKDLGDFIRAYQTASLEWDGELPDEWEQLHTAIQARSWIRHKSQPKIEDAVTLAESYLDDPSNGVKAVMFTMNIDIAERLGRALEDVTENVFIVHSQVASSTAKKDRIVRQRIDAFSESDHGVLIAPKLLDEGIDVPDAEIGINVAGTRTKLQLVQRMGRILRKHGDQRPLFHHFVAVPDEHYLEGLDDKEYVQEVHWVRELGAQIGQQPTVEPAGTHSRITDRTRSRGMELWAEDLLENQDIETVQGSINLEEILEGITPDVARVLSDVVDTDQAAVSEDAWEGVMEQLQIRLDLPAAELQRLWWLFPLYRERPGELHELLLERLEGADVAGEEGPTIADDVADRIRTEALDTDGGSGGETPPTQPTAPGERGGSRGEQLATSRGDTPSGLSEKDIDRIRDIIELAPTKNGELAEQWDFQSGSQVHQYLQSTVSEYYTRNEQRYIVPTTASTELIESESPR